MTQMGHGPQFPPPEASARYRFGQRTFTGTRGNERDAPIAAVEAWKLGDSRTGSLTNLQAWREADFKLGLRTSEPVGFVVIYVIR